MTRARLTLLGVRKAYHSSALAAVLVAASLILQIREAV